MMRILHVNTATFGGAAIAAIRIHKALIDQGIDSHFLSLTTSSKYIPNHHIFEGKVIMLSLLVFLSLFFIKYLSS